MDLPLTAEPHELMSCFCTRVKTHKNRRLLLLACRTLWQLNVFLGEEPLERKLIKVSVTNTPLLAPTLAVCGRRQQWPKVLWEKGSLCTCRECVWAAALATQLKLMTTGNLWTRSLSSRERERKERESHGVSAETLKSPLAVNTGWVRIGWTSSREEMEIVEVNDTGWILKNLFKWLLLNFSFVHSSSSYSRFNKLVFSHLILCMVLQWCLPKWSIMGFFVWLFCTVVCNVAISLDLKKKTFLI